MKKFIISMLLAVFILSGCAGQFGTQGSKSYVTREEVLELIKSTDKDALLDLMEGSEAAYIRAFTGLTGETTGTLDNIDVANLNDGDLAFVYNLATSTVRFYEFNDSSSYTAEVSPHWITPKNGADGASGDKWEALSSFGFAPTTDPESVWRDLDATDFDKNFRIAISCNNGSCSSGSEDIDVYFQAQIGGTAETTFFALNCDASGNCSIEMTPAGTGLVEIMHNGVTGDGLLTTADDTYICFASISGYKAGEDVKEFDAVFIATDGKWDMADATTAGAEYPAIGFAIECPGGGGWPCQDTEEIVVCTSGIIRNDAWTFATRGLILYLDDTTSGAIIATAPSDDGDAVQVMAITIKSETAGDDEDVIIFPVQAWGEDDGS